MNSCKRALAGLITAQTWIMTCIMVVVLLSANPAFAQKKDQESRPELTEADIRRELGNTYWGHHLDGKRIGYCEVRLTQDAWATPPCYRFLNEIHTKEIFFG